MSSKRQKRSNKTLINFIFDIVNKVSAHIRRVSQEGSCKPKLKVIPLEHHPSKTFNPHCTVLHRCSDDTGCCHADFSTCKPRRVQNVTLPFYVSQLTNLNGNEMSLSNWYVLNKWFWFRWPSRKIITLLNLWHLKITLNANAC